MSTAAIEEQTRLEDCQARIRNALHDIDARLTDYAREIRTRKEYLWDARRDMDRNLLYVACTRAMHRLTLIAVGERPACYRHPR